jgi:predicted Zn-dependent protease with MMP-like domain
MREWAAATFVGVGVLCAGLASSASGATNVPYRSHSAHPNCAVEPGSPVRYLGFDNGFNTRANFPIEGAIDANGCDSYIYEPAGSFGPYGSFFAGPGFAPGQFAYQFGTKETTKLVGGRQLIEVDNPTKQWRRVYAGYDLCSSYPLASGRSATTCLAPALEARPANDLPQILVGVILGSLLLFTAHFLRPTGLIRRRRRFRKVHGDLRLAVAGPTPAQMETLDLRQLRRRLRRLERSLTDVTLSQHHWFQGLIASGHHGLAIEAVARWLSESPVPIPDHLRQEVVWIASSLDIEHHVRPVLDAQMALHDEEPSTEGTPSRGFDVPYDEFKELVTRAVDSLPAVFGKAMTNVAFVIEEEHPDHDRLGQYQGTPLARNALRWSHRPDKITIYRLAICDRCHNRAEVEAMVYRVVIHEIAHHFGIDDPRLRELGWG